MKCDHCLEMITKDDIGYAIKTEDDYVFCCPECLKYYYLEQSKVLEEWEIDEEDCDE